MLCFEGGLYSVLVVGVLHIRLLLPSVGGGSGAKLTRLRLLRGVDLLECVMDERMRVVEHCNGVVDFACCGDAHLAGRDRFVFRVVEVADAAAELVKCSVDVVRGSS